MPVTGCAGLRFVIRVNSQLSALWNKLGRHRQSYSRRRPPHQRRHRRGAQGSALFFSSSSVPELIQPGTKLSFEEEYIAGIEKQYAGFVFSALYSDRRLLRILEDQSGASPQGNISGYALQYLLIGNPSSTSDYFTNEVEVPYAFNTALPNDGAPRELPVEL